MSEGRELVKEAIKDAKSLKEAAVESAKNQIVESLAPAVKELLDKSIKGVLNEASPAGHVAGVRKLGGKVVAGQQRAENADPNDPDSVDEGTSAELTLEDALQEFFPGNGAAGTQTVEEKNMEVNDKNEKQGPVKEATDVKSSDKSSVSETYEISDAELRKVYEAAMQTEVQVKKGFGDVAKPAEIETAVKDSGILPKKGGEKNWEKEEPPAKKDWVPENVQRMLEAGLAENKALRENLRKAVAMVETLGKKLHEVNLFNSKVLHVNKILNSGTKLTKEQKTYVMESIDKARSIGEVKMVYETIVGALKTTTAALQEGRVVRPPKADAAKARTSGTPDPKVISESVDRSTDDKFSRVRQLAGIVSGKK
jgi:hypothetical protein